jgi:hypothetical protein
LRSAAFNSKPGMEMQAIMGTYVLHEHAFAVKSSIRALSDSPS